MQRRNFLKSFGIAGTVVAVPALLTTAMSSSHKRKAHPSKTVAVTLKGKVHSKGQGIAGIAVTDGMTITLTDSRGRYQFESTSDSEFVYISTPRGYAFNHHKGVASFFQTIVAGNGTYNADFSLEKLEINDHTHYFVVWADPQIKSESHAQELKATVALDLKTLVQAHPQHTLFHGIGCGDLVWDRLERFDDYKHAIQGTGIPFFNIIGNHDLDRDATTDANAAKTFRRQFGPTHYSFNRGEIHYVVLDNVFSIGGNKHIGYLTGNQLQWLEQDLALVKPGGVVVLSMHIPTNTGEARRNGKEERIEAVVANREQLYKILKPFKVHILSGHTHVNESWEEGNIREHVHGAVCGAWWTGPVCSDGTPNGYAVYKVSGGDLQWYYKAIGKPKEHQIRIYAQGKAAAYPDEVSANVWNWDDGWKIEWYEDDVLKGGMERRVATDPWAVELLLNADQSKKYTFIEPTLTDHLFFAKPSPAAKNITVKATDRFGNVFLETMPLWREQVLFQSFTQQRIVS